MTQKTQDLWNTVSPLLKQWDFRNRAKERPVDFTRERKIGFVGVVSIIFNLVRRSTQLEWDDFRERFFPKQEVATSYTKQSFAEARQKLRPEAFTWLNEAFIDRYYAEPDYQTFHGFRVLAVDGCVAELPDSADVREVYGVAKAQGGFTVARARTSQLFDVENHITLDAILAPYRTGERDLARQHMDALRCRASAKIPTIILFDRGYPSLALIVYLLHYGFHFLMRVSTGFYPQIVGTAASHETVTLRLSAAQARALQQQGVDVAAGTAISLRVLKVVLPSGQMETLVTDLTPMELPAEQGSALYFQRWGIETHDGQDKHTLEIENFSGFTPRVIAQDYHATILFSNLAAVIRQDAQAAWEATRDQLHRKYDQDRINFNLLIGKLKYRLLGILLESNLSKQLKRYERLIAILVRYIVPVIPGRKAPRRKKRRKTNKYAITMRRCL